MPARPRWIGAAMIGATILVLATTSFASVRHSVREGAVVTAPFRVDPVDHSLWES